MDCIVVSAETIEGGKLVNEKRNLNRLSELTIHEIPLVINLLDDKNSGAGGESKLSSTYSRRKLFERNKSVH